MGARCATRSTHDNVVFGTDEAPVFRSSNVKIRITDHQCRVRVSREEFDGLCGDPQVAPVCALSKGPGLSFQLQLVDQDEADLHHQSDGWRIRIPRAAAIAFRSRLPRREGLDFHVAGEWQDHFRLTLEVDLR